MDEFLSEQEVSRRVNRTRQTLWRWRQSGDGPPFIKIGRTIRYPATQFERWHAKWTADQDDGGEGDNSNRPGI